MSDAPRRDGGAVVARRPFIYPHRSVTALPFARQRMAFAAAFALVLAGATWRWMADILYVHNAIVLFFIDALAVPGIRLQAYDLFGNRGVLVSIDNDPGVRIPTIFATLALIVGLALAAWRWPLLRGIVAFVVMLLGVSALAYGFDAPAMRSTDTFASTWTRAETTVWLVLPLLAALLFVGVQPLLGAGVLWTLAAQAGAVVWSAVRLVLLLIVAQWTGTLLLPAIWFTWGLLADLLYVTSLFSISIYATLSRLPKRRAAWQS